MNVCRECYSWAQNSTIFIQNPHPCSSAIFNPVRHQCMIAFFDTRIQLLQINVETNPHGKYANAR